ncbi:MAG: site-specific integrase, partial [Anaerolineae bacterium]
MSTPKRDQLILLKRSPLDLDIAAFLVDRQARGLSPRTLQFYRDELRYFREWAQVLGVTETLALAPNLLREYLLDLARNRNPGGVHAAYRALRAFLNWYGQEYEPEGWQNPMAKVRPPKLP